MRYRDVMWYTDVIYSSPKHIIIIISFLQLSKYYFVPLYYFTLFSRATVSMHQIRSEPKLNVQCI